MESIIPGGGFQLPFQRRLSRLYNDTKKSSDFVQEQPQSPDDPEIKALHRKLRIQKDRLVSWGLEWSDPDQTAEIDESLSQAGLTDLVGSIMATIKDILAEAEPLWLASKRSVGSEKAPEKAVGDRKTSLIVWDKGRFEDLVRDLTASIDTLCDLSRTRSSMSRPSKPATGPMESTTSTEDLRRYSSTRIHTPQQIDPRSLTRLQGVSPASRLEPTGTRLREICFMDRQAYAELTRRSARQPQSPLLVEYAYFDSIYSVTGVMPEMSRFEKLSAGLQTESQRAPGAWIGLPLLLGYYEDMDHSRLALVYQFPPPFHPVSFQNHTSSPLDTLSSLTSLLSRSNFEPTLEARFRLAYNLTNTVFDMHARGITHGNINASTISFCNVATSDDALALEEVDIRRPLLSSFDIFPDSQVEGQSPSAFQLHRHPLDPRTTRESPFASNGENQKTLDLYSLAMVLVSVGLWSSLGNLAPSETSPGIPESILSQLAIRCGTPYMRAVRACWNAVETELANPGKGDEIISQAQLVASRYLEACCILDGVSGLDDRFGEELAHPPPATAGAPEAIASPPFSGPSTRPSTTRKSNPEPAATQNVARVGTTDIKPLSRQAHGQPQASTPKPSRPKLRLYPHISLSSEIIEQWNSLIMPQINLALRHFYRKNPESVEISLESIGESPQKTTPTVLVVCTSVGKVRAILKHKLGILFDGDTGFSLKVCRGSVLRSRKGPTRSIAGGGKPTPSEGQHDSEDSDREEAAAANPDFQERPRNGASIGAWIGDRHLPPVSFGGLIMVDDKPYGMTVHHMLDDPDGPSLPGDAKRCNAPPLRSSAASQGALDLQAGDWNVDSSSGSSDGFTCEFSDSESETSETDMTSDDEDDSYDDDDEDMQFNEPGDIPGIEPGCGDGYVVTQPALDDINEDFYPSEETMDEDHLDTCSLGDIYASSGIRRRSENGLVHEVDWALFEFHDERLPDDNAISMITFGAEQGVVAPTDARQPTEVAPSRSLPGLEVQCTGRTSGLKTGRIMPTITSVKIYGRTSPSHTYQHHASSSSTTTPGQGQGQGQGQGPRPRQPRRKQGLTRPLPQPLPLGVPGDSGAWVVDRRHGRLCGHVLAWSERKQTAYICPMDLLLLDIAETLGAVEVRLPGGEAVVSLVTEQSESELEEGEVEEEEEKVRCGMVDEEARGDDDNDDDDDDDVSESESWEEGDDAQVPGLVPASASPTRRPKEGFRPETRALAFDLETRLRI
ncbi:hypothetical protein GGR56DRAFT_663928 [Xylariaceae sp. FL0804]|nr:hypothetical protein GGR56DRAFT_663928 [Xylariaceae sp. FL0804]